MLKYIAFLLMAGVLCAGDLAGGWDGLLTNEREINNFSPGVWHLQLQAARSPGGMDLYRGLTLLANLPAPGCEALIPEQEGFFLRYRSLDDIRFVLRDRRGCDGGVLFQVGRNLRLTAVGGDRLALERVLDLGQLRLGNLDILEAEWPCQAGR